MASRVAPWPSKGLLVLCPPAWGCTQLGAPALTGGVDRGSMHKSNQLASPRKGLILELQIWYPIAGCFG